MFHGKRVISQQQICHPDRSEAQWRDLRFLFLGWAPPYLQRFPNLTLERMVQTAPSLSVYYLGGLPPGK
jgi:hypothetical protein